MTEFIVHDLPARKIRLPLRAYVPEPREQIVMEVGRRSEAYAAMAQALSANARWWRDHHVQIVAAYSDTHIAISLGEVFQGASYFDALARAQAAHPADLPLVLYLVRPPPANSANGHAN